MLSRPATSVAKVKHLVRGLEYLVPANFTNPKYPSILYSACTRCALRFHLCVQHERLMSNFQESVKAVTRDKVSGTTQNYAIYN